VFASKSQTIPLVDGMFRPELAGASRRKFHGEWIALIRIARGLVAVIEVTGPANPELFHAVPAQ
jgi:hypothetical protein